MTLVLSLGPERYDVPQLAGQTEDQAQDALAATNLTFGESVGRWSETVPEGQVIRTSPKAGTTLKPGATVDLVLSRGRKPIERQGLDGQGLRRRQGRPGEAQAAGERPSEEYSDTVPAGDIISQDPTPRHALPRRHRLVRRCRSDPSWSRCRR